MANKFLSNVNIEQNISTPSFVNPSVDTRDIARAGTTGNELTDIIFDKSIQMANKVTNLKRQNELADIKIQASKNIQDYELEWSKKDKYSDENYNDYISGLQGIYEKNRTLISNTSFTKEEDVNAWDKQTNLDWDNTNFKTNGEKAQYDIKKITDETTLKIDSLNNEYISTGDKNTRLQILKLYDGLSEIGIPQYEIEHMKVKTLVDSDLARMKQEINLIINDPKKSIEDKVKLVSDLNKGLSGDTLYNNDMEVALKNGYIDKNSAEIYKSYAKKSIQDGWLNSGGVLEKLNQNIRDEQYRIETQIATEQLKRENQILKEKEDVGNYFKGGNDLKGISLLEGYNVTGRDMVVNQGLAMKYYGETPQNILWQTDDNGKKIFKKNGYIPTLSTYEINDLKNKARIDSENKIARSETAYNVYSNIINLDGNEKENLQREYIANGVMTSLEVGLMNGEVVPQMSDTYEMIDYANIGSSSSRFNKLGGFVGIGNGSTTSDLRKELDKLGNDYYKKQQLSEIVVGAMVSGKFGITFDGTKGIDATTFRIAYNTNSGFRAFVNDSINVVNQIDRTKYKKAPMKEIDYRTIIDKKYDNKPIQIRRKTLETGTEPYIEEINDYENF